MSRVEWRATTRLRAAGTTLDRIRREQSFRGPQELYGPGSVVLYQVGDTFVTLPVGKVWRQSVQAVPPSGWADRAIERSYWLDRGVVQDGATGGPRRLFSVFTVSCRHRWCAGHELQFDAVMRSIRLLP